MLKCYDGILSKPDGYVMLHVKYKSTTKPVKWYVVERASANVLGRDWISNSSKD